MSKRAVCASLAFAGVIALQLPAAAEPIPEGAQANRSWGRIKHWLPGMQLGGNNNYDSGACKLPDPMATGQCMCNGGFDGSAFTVLRVDRQMYFGKCAGHVGPHEVIGVAPAVECPITDPGREFVGPYEAPICPLPYPLVQKKDCTSGVCGVVGATSTYPGNGNKNLVQTDYPAAAGSLLRFVRTYNSGIQSIPNPMGVRWRHHYQRWILRDSESQVIAYREDGTSFLFRRSAAGAVWMPDADRNERVFDIRSGDFVVGWHLVNDRDEVERYDAYGRLRSITDRQGRAVALTYSDQTNLEAGSRAAGLPYRITDHVGRSLTLVYDALLRVAAMVDPGGGIYRYSYDAASRLIAVEFPDGKTRQYHYEDASNPHALTGVTDELGQRYATLAYDALGRVTVDELAGSVHRYSMSYASGTASVTDPLQSIRNYGYETVHGVPRLSAIQGPGCPSCGPASQAFDRNGNVSSRVDWNGNRTDYTYDLSRNLEIVRTEGLTRDGGTTAQTRTITTQWHPAYRLATVVAEPLRITTNVYGEPNDPNPGNRGSLLTKTVQATTDASGGLAFGATLAGPPRTWTYTYDTQGLVLSIDGPRSDTVDVTSYTYDAQGSLASITNAAGHRTEITTYNAHGQPLRIVDPNGLVTTLTYDLRLRVTSRSVGGETTRYEYNAAGQLETVTLPDGTSVSHSYDAAHRLTGMRDNAGNRIAYTLDTMGNRLGEEVFDAVGALAQKRSRVYSSLNRVLQDIGARNQTTEYAYDDQGNLVSVKDPLQRVTLNQYDALNRLVQITDAAKGITRYAYNGLDALTQVTDPRNLVTGYTVDGLGNLTLQSSPDTGNTVSAYDVAGNLLTQTDAKGQVTTYAYDALGRVTLIAFHDGSKQLYAYDQGMNGIGRLTSIREVDATGAQTSQIVYTYSEHGRVLSETRTVAGVSYVTSYRYDSGGRLAGMTYPSGRGTTYRYDTGGRMEAITTTFEGDTQPLVSNVIYHPFGGVKSYVLGNGQTYARNYDQDGRVSSYTLGAKSFGIGYDPAGRIEFISDFGNPTHSTTYGYDALDRLTSATTPGTPYTYSYDAVGNRLTKTAGTGGETITYSATSNRISTVTLATGATRDFVFDANGSTTSDGVNTYVYDPRGRMVSSTSAVGVSNYQINALGQRVRKTSSLGDTVFHYDTAGRLIAETSPAGTVKREILYLGDIPVGVVQ